MNKDKRKALTSLLWMLGIVSFFIAGFTLGIWHYAWLVFPVVVCANIAIETFFGNSERSQTEENADNPENNKNEPTELMKMKDKIIPVIWIGAVCIYLCLGFFVDLWHPGWIVFLVAIIPSILLQR